MAFALYKFKFCALKAVVEQIVQNICRGSIVMKKIITVWLKVWINICLAICICQSLSACTSKSIDTAPEIFCKQELLEISVNITEKELLENVIANDKEDGNLSGKVHIDSISEFDKDMLRTVGYSVSDSFGNISKASCKIKYTDYTEASFSLSTIERYNSVSDIKLTYNIKVDDMLDGDISEKAELYTDTANFGIGAYPCKVGATNSAGAVSYVTVYIQITDQTEYLPSIYLNEYIKYVEIGENIDLRDMIRSVNSDVISSVSADGVIVYELIPNDRVEINGSVDTNAEGEYYIRYSASNSKGITGYSYLTVVVR